MYAGQTTTATEQKRDATLNDRLNRVNDAMQQHCERIDRVLASVNGAPEKVAGDSRLGATPIRTTMSLVNTTESLETINARLNELVGALERIA